MTLSISDRWWPSADTGSLFSIPPFPGSRAIPVVEASPAVQDGPLPTRAVRADEASKCVAAMRRMRVGGTFWADQPSLPTGPFILARPSDPDQFRAMAASASKQPMSVIFWFPDRRAWHNSGVAAATAVVGPCDPWHFLSGASEVWADPDDELALLAAIADVPHRFFTHSADVKPPLSPETVEPVSRLSALISNFQFRDPFSGGKITPSSLIETLGFWRDLIDANRPIGAIHGIAFWKRPSIAPLMWNGHGTVAFDGFFRSAPDASASPASAAWIARTPKSVLQRLAAADTPLFQIEDGFIRSVGLGADCVPPLSIVVDPYGAHYDPAQASGLERLLTTQDFAPEMLDRARRLRELIVARGISKYGISARMAVREGRDRRNVLVIGQVEDDQSVIKGGGEITSNFNLLRRVRAVEPNAFIIYRPHPDVDAGHRKGYIKDDVVLSVADSIAREVAITSLIDIADDVHVLTSLAGFEALMRGKPVTTHGVPFYAGWGLTTDLGPVPAHRQRRRSLDELVAATLLLYPRYLDPVTGLPCPPEVLIDRLLSGVSKNGPLVFARRILGSLTRRARNLSARHNPRQHVQ
jgi:capsular polysaccharide export protein